MGVGKLVIAVLLICLLSFGLVTAFSMAQKDKPTDSLGENTNATVELVNVVGGAGTNLMVPLIMISGILLLMGIFMVFRKVR
jgi:hypothetical protein